MKIQVNSNGKRVDDFVRVENKGGGKVDGALKDDRSCGGSEASAR